MTRLELLKNTDRNVFTTDDLMVLWDTCDRRKIIESVKDYVRRGRLFSPRRGIYTIKNAYDGFEMAHKLMAPSYIGYYSALAYYGIIFQHYNEIHCMGPYSKKITLEGQIYIYHKLKDSILMNKVGIKKEDNYSISLAERAICDSLFLNKKIAFDNIANLDKNKLREISLIYRNKRLEKDIDKLIKDI